MVDSRRRQHKRCNSDQQRNQEWLHKFGDCFLFRSKQRTWLVWLNPLLRWDGFEPKSQGIRAMLPHVDEFRTVHNLASLRALVASLSAPPDLRAMDRWRLAA